MSVALALGLGFFVLTAVATVFSVGLISGYRNTVELLRQKAELMTSAELDRLRSYLGAAEDQLDFAARLIAKGEVEPGPSEEFTSLLLGSLAATPQIVAILYIDGEYRLTGAERREDETSTLFASVRGDDILRPILEQARTAESGWWGEPVWREEYATGLMAYSLPISVEGAFTGVLTALVSVRLLSEFISDLETSFGANAFVLYGRDLVLAHPLLAFGYDELTRLTPLPKQDSFSDPVLSSMWHTRELGYLEGLVLEGPGIHAVTLGSIDYVFLYREVEGYADRPLYVGTYFLSSDMMDEVLRFKWAALFCLIISLISAATAAFIGRQIAQPVRRLGQGAMQIYELDLSQVQPVPGSFFRELDDSARSFNTMLDGLRWFERYVPRSLVRKLIAAHPDRSVETSFRDVVIMFTDIWNFTSFTEDMTAPQTAAFLNDHFTMIADAIEHEGGVVDKYMGDGVMAIWGAPESYDDLADRACRAVLAIKQAFEDRDRPAESLRLQLRIGLHLGRVVAGNIGSPGRINYTVVGDAVNVAQRLEELGRSLGNVEAEVNILISGSLRGALTRPFALEPLGPQEIRGRRERVEVYVLKGQIS
jgi:class 3 adenylate cyclase